MALKSNFEATSDISSPFVDEIANPGQLTTFSEALNAAQGKPDKKPEPSTQISAADRAAAIAGTPDEKAQNQVNLDEARHGNRAGNKNRAKAEGR